LPAYWYDDTAIIFHADYNFELQAIIKNCFERYYAWCVDNCTIINPRKSNYLTFNDAHVVTSVNGQVLLNPNVVKYLGVYVDNNCCGHIMLIMF
jgi:hypothetical protein